MQDSGNKSINREAPFLMTTKDLDHKLINIFKDYQFEI